MGSFLAKTYTPISMHVVQPVLSRGRNVPCPSTTYLPVTRRVPRYLRHLPGSQEPVEVDQVPVRGTAQP